MKYLVTCVALFGLAACTNGSFPGGFQAANPSGATEGTDLSSSRPTLDGADLPPLPPANARTVEQFDTTSPDDRAAAMATPGGGERRLGTTIASLGSPTEPGIWFKTPLVTTVTLGRLAYQGNSVSVELRPSGGAAGSGSQISLAAMRLIEAPLTGLPEVVVYAN